MGTIRTTKKQLQELVKRLVKQSLLENPHLLSYSDTNPLEDVVGILELISQKIMNFPVDNKQAMMLLPNIILDLEKIDGALERLSDQSKESTSK